MDKSQHSKLSQAFEQAAEREAEANPLPEQLWQHIAQDLSTHTPVESGQRIQQAFEEQPTPALLPANIWDNIAKELESNKIKESFEAEENPTAPTAIWNAIEEELEIETVWKKVHKTLDKRTSWLYWREKMIQGSLVLLILLWLRGCEWETPPANPIVSDPVAATKAYSTDLLNAHSKTKQTPSTTASAHTQVTKTNQEPNNQNSVNITPTAATTLKTEGIKEDAPKAYIAQKSINTASNRFQKAFANANIPHTAVTNLGTSQVVTVNKKETTWLENSSSLNDHSSHADERTQAVRPIEPSSFSRPNTNKKTLSPEGELLPRNPTITTNSTIATSTNAVTNSTTSTVDATTNAPTLLPKAPKLTDNLPTLTADNISNPFVLVLEAIELQKVQQARQKQQSHIEFGLEARVRGTILLGNMTTEAMESTSMMKTKLMPTIAVGANLAWYFTYNDALVVSLHPMADSRQYFGGYTEEGRYYHKEIKLSYFDIEAAYQRTLFHYNDFGALPSTVYARLSYGFGYLNKGETILNGTATDETTLYNNTNHNIGLTLGNTHRFQRWVIDYGIYGQLGVSTIHLQQPTNYSQLLGVGAYLGLRYSL
ncbi:MAG: hypothetical protein AB8E82_15225 [Aureispira sp.]